MIFFLTYSRKLNYKGIINPPNKNKSLILSKLKHLNIYYPANKMIIKQKNNSFEQFLVTTNNKDQIYSQGKENQIYIQNSIIKIDFY